MQLFLLLTLVSLGTAAIAAQDYFPLIPGSEWTYRSDSTDETLRLEIGDLTVVNGKQYHFLRGYSNNDLRVRQSDTSLFIYLDAADGTEKVLFDLSGGEFASPATICQQKGRTEKEVTTYSGPLGSFSGAKTVAYLPGLCSDTGLTREFFVPSLGLVRRTVTTFIGERNFDLIYAQIGGITYLSEPASTFGLSVTPVPGVRPAGSRLSARLTLNHKLADVLTLRFTSGQIFDFQLRNERGEGVYTWSADKIFITALQTVVVKGERSWTELIPVASLPAGTYSLEGKLVNTEGGRFSATATFKLP